MSDDANSLHIFEVLATQHEPMLLAYLASLLGDYALAEDVAQQSLIIAYRKINTLKEPAAFPSWARGSPGPQVARLHHRDRNSMSRLCNLVCIQGSVS